MTEASVFRLYCFSAVTYLQAICDLELSDSPTLLYIIIRAHYELINNIITH